MQTGQRIGTSIGIAVITAVFFGTLHHASWAVALSSGFVMIALVLALALVFAYKDFYQRQRLWPVRNYGRQAPPLKGITRRSEYAER